MNHDNSAIQVIRLDCYLVYRSLACLLSGVFDFICRLRERTYSLWGYTSRYMSNFSNPFYKKNLEITQPIIVPVTNPQSFKYSIISPIYLFILCAFSIFLLVCLFIDQPVYFYIFKQFLYSGTSFLCLHIPGTAPLDSTQVVFSSYVKE